MKRRTLLGAGAAAGIPALSGCVGTILGDRELRTPIPVRIESEADTHYYLELTARELESGRQAYGQQLTIRAGERAEADRLDGVEQRLRVSLYTRQDFEDPVTTVEATIDDGTDSVSVLVTERDLEIDVESGNGGA